jgi:hypothetical protein
MVINLFAPVCIPTLCRYEHFKRCVESLSQCTHSEKTDLFIALDFPLKNSHKDGYEKICEYVTTIKGFKNVIIIKREINYGAANNAYDIMHKVLEKYDRLIFSEDDNEFSSNFLDYINKGLEKYRANNKIFAVCGYNFTIEMPASYKYNHYYMNEFCAWGYGIWKNKYEEFEKCCNNIYIKQKLKKNLFRLRDSVIMGLFTCLGKHEILGDMIITLKLVDEKQYCVFPYISLVRNWGLDGTGENNRRVTRKSKNFFNQIIDDRLEFEYDNLTTLKPDPVIQKKLYKYFSPGFPRKTKLFLKYIYHMIKGK